MRDKVTKVVYVFIATIVCKFTFAGRESFFKVQGRSFLLINQQSTQNEALLSCLQFGGQLLMILTEEIDDKVAQMMTDSGTSSLITSGKYNSEVRQWEWSITATPFGYTNWSPSSPNLKDYCCFKYSSTGYRWRADLCTSTGNAFVCQLPMGTEPKFNSSFVLLLDDGY